MTLLRSQFVELEGSIQAVFDAYKETKTDFIPQLFNKMSSSRSQENHLGLGALSQMTEWTGQVAYQEFSKGYKSEYRHVKYSTGLQIDRETMEDEEFGEIKKRANQTAYAVHKTLQIHAASPFNNAFSSFKTPDAVSLCNSTHHIIAGDTAQGNTGTSELTVDSLETTMIAMRNFTDDKGDIMDVQPSLIICGNYWEKTAKQICGSDKEAYTADNQMNAYKETLTYLVNPWITGKKWFLVDPDLMKNGTGLNWYMRRDPGKVEYIDDFDTEVGKYKCVGRWSYGADTFYFVYGHNPA